MSKRVKRNIAILNAIPALKPDQRKGFISHCSDDFILSICEICLNVLKGNIPLNSEQYSRLKKHKTFIKLLADKKSSVKKKRKVVKQSGGFIGPLLSIALPFISGLIGRS